MVEAIDLVGPGNQGFSAKSFHPTGVTVAVENGVHPNIAMKLCRWKTCSSSWVIICMQNYLVPIHLICQMLN